LTIITARPLRIEYPGAFYHVTARGNERKRIYFTKRDYLKFREYIVDAHEKYGCLLHVYVFMSNHYHMILETPKGNISKVMHFINGSYTNYINRKRDRSGHLFQGRYKAILVDKDNYLLELSRYIHLNPVRANIVERPEEYINSSYGSYIGKRKDDIVQHDQILQMISKDRKNAPNLYKHFVENAAGGDLENPFLKVYGGSILGEKSFIKQALDALKEGVVNRKEISHRKVLESAFESDVVINAVSEYFGIKKEAVRNDRKKYRNICIYIMKKYTRMTNGQIGQNFNDLSYSAVSKAYQRVAKAIDEKKQCGKM